MRKAVLGVLAIGVLTIVPAERAVAACHAFTVSASPQSVAEGGAVTVTVERDAGFGESSIDLSTVNESAIGGSDFAPMNQKVNFTTETTRTVQLQTINDNVAESAETLRLHLSNPGGCAVNPRFQVGPDARVTITDNDAPAATSPPAAATTAARPTTTRAGATTTTAGSTSTAETLVAEETTTTGDDPVIIEQASGEDDDDGDAGPLLIALGVIAVLGAGGGLAYYRMRAARS